MAHKKIAFASFVPEHIRKQTKRFLKERRAWILKPLSDEPEPLTRAQQARFKKLVNDVEKSKAGLPPFNPKTGERQLTPEYLAATARLIGFSGVRA